MLALRMLVREDSDFRPNAEGGLVEEAVTKDEKEGTW
jgi:hypothetical protein